MSAKHPWFCDISDCSGYASPGGPGEVPGGKGTEGISAVYPRWWAATVVPVSSGL